MTDIGALIALAVLALGLAGGGLLTGKVFVPGYYDSGNRYPFGRLLARDRMPVQYWVTIVLYLAASGMFGIAAYLRING